MYWSAFDSYILCSYSPFRSLSLPSSTFNASLGIPMPARRAPSIASVAQSRAPSPTPDEEETQFFDTVDELQQHGINVQDILKLKSAAINTVFGVSMTTRRQMLKIKGMSEAKVEKIKEAAHKILGSSFATGVEVQDKRKRVNIISTGSKSVDGILGGGLMSQSISEGNTPLFTWVLKPCQRQCTVYGEFRTGKTQLAHTMSVVAQLPPEMGGASGKVAYIDTEGTLFVSPCAPLLELAQAPFARIELGRLRTDLALTAIWLLKIFYMHALSTASTRWNSSMNAPYDLLKIKTFACLYNVIIDSIMALFRVDYSGRGELSERQQKLAQMLSKLTKLSEEYNIAILLTNQVQSDPGATMTFVAGGALKPIGGHILSHASATRMFLRKGRAEERVAKLVDSPDRPESEASYKLDEGGWADV
ncbi:hypothetical protein D9613_002199 [Agrocybe pediades]|uniref:Uncharacterized protein n=3 Tax=Agaricomycetes TaxID=155619 RepID=A0A8H4R4S9_9AGAR|nr:hypothetical protein D9613_002199 [Agrocybe pediades]